MTTIARDLWVLEHQILPRCYGLKYGALQRMIERIKTQVTRCRMFTPDTPMTLTDVTFTTEVVDDETRRVVECTWKLSPFTPAQAESLTVRSLIFEARSGLPKPGLDQAVVQIAVPLQRVTFKMAPDQETARIVFEDVTIEPKLRIKVKQDRDPVVCDAVLKMNFRYPAADDLLYLANGVNDTHYLSFDTTQGALGFDDAAPITVGAGRPLLDPAY